MLASPQNNYLHCKLPSLRGHPLHSLQITTPGGTKTPLADSTNSCGLPARPQTDKPAPSNLPCDALSPKPASISAQSSAVKPPKPLGDTNVPDPAKAINTDSQGEKENSQPPSAAPPPTANNSAEGVEHLTDPDSSCPPEPEKTVEPEPGPNISPEAEWNSLDDDDGTPPEKLYAEVQKSDSNKGKAAKAS
ncbi:hypothetical protein CYMTET_48052, partial [Cymbomonas tetramitiformis]